MLKDPQVTLYDVVSCLSDAIDLVSPALVDHHRQVSYIAARIAGEMGFDAGRCVNLVLAGAMHDAGALSLQERIESLEFELDDTERHCRIGESLLRMFQPLSHLAGIVRHHHAHWQDGAGWEIGNEEIPMESHILHLADRVSVLIDRRREILGQVQEIREKIAPLSGSVFVPMIVEAFEALSEKEYFWLDAVTSRIGGVLQDQTRLRSLMLDLTELKELSDFLSRIIDFRSSFTATHSAGVAASAETLAQFAGFSARECNFMSVAGHLHDLGKLAVSTEILEKPAKLDQHEFNVIRSHTYHTYRILDTLQDFDQINVWGSFHHERLDGTGYPFHHSEHALPLGSRIMAVADVYTAITEDRPYRAGMNHDKSMNVLDTMVKKRLLDGDVVSLLRQNFADVDHRRRSAQSELRGQYRAIYGHAD